MENEYTILDVIKNRPSLFIRVDESHNLLYRYNEDENIIEYTSNVDWYPTANSLKSLANMKFIKYEPTYTIDDLIRNQGKFYELEDEPTLYTVKGGILYFYSEVYRKWLESILSYNTIIGAEFIEYIGGYRI